MKKRFPDFHCICQNPLRIERDLLLKEFGNIREKCPALKEILVPDSNWTNFQEWEKRGFDKAWHKSILLLALYNGNLHKITSPIHRFLLDGNCISSNLRPNYRGSLNEHWLRQDSELRRHQEAKRFMGYISELLYADWLIKHGWEIDNLEALGGENDITANNEKGERYVFEVKFLGQDDEEFIKMWIESSNGIATWSFSLCQPRNYIISRIHDAAKQLDNTEDKRIAVLILNETIGSKLDMLFRGNRINWHSPSFLKHESIWYDFLPAWMVDGMNDEGRKAKALEAEKELKNFIPKLHSVKIMKLEYFEPKEKYSFNVRK